MHRYTHTHVTKTISILILLGTFHKWFILVLESYYCQEHFNNMKGYSHLMKMIPPLEEQGIKMICVFQSSCWRRRTKLFLSYNKMLAIICQFIPNNGIQHYLETGYHSNRNTVVAWVEIVAWEVALYSLIRIRCALYLEFMH